MKEIEFLLENFWVDRVKNREEYSEIMKNKSKIEKFFIEKTGWKVIFNSEIIKVEKIPAKAENFMGISTFTDRLDYCILCGLLLFLEERENGEQFLLNDITERIEFFLKEYIEIDWTKFTHRKSLIRAFEYAEGLRLLEKTDGNLKNFAEDEHIEVLYEKTGLSRYFSVNFGRNISGFASYKDFENEKSENIDTAIGEIRTNRVYRKLLLTPAVYWDNQTDSDSIYIRNQKPVLENNLEKLFGGKLHVHKNSAFLVYDTKNYIGDIHPKGSMLSEIVLLICDNLREKIVSNKLEKQLNDLVVISSEYLKDLIKECKNRYGTNWSKEYRDMSEDKIYKNVVEYMKEWSFIEEKENEIILFPSIGKVTGKYRKDNKIIGETDE